MHQNVHITKKEVPMPRIAFTISNEEKVELEAKSKSLGLSVSHYIRNLVLDRSRAASKDTHSELIKAIRALVPTFADGLGRMNKLPPDVKEIFTKTLLKRYEEERGWQS